jgi:hypothetical protein
MADGDDDKGGGAPPGGTGGGAPPGGAGGEAPKPPGGGAPGVAPWAAHSGEGPWPIGDKPWYETIPEAPVKELMAQKNYKTPHETAVAYYNLNKITSTEDARKVIIPGADAKPEEWDAFHTKLGRPPNPEGYNEVFKFDDKVKVDPTVVDFGKKLAHKLGLEPRRSKMMADEWNAFAAEQGQKSATTWSAENDKEVETVKSKWGNDADALIEGGRRVYKSLGLDEALMSKIEAHVGAAPVIELLARIGKATAESGFMGGGQGGGGGDPNAMTAEGAAMEIARLNGDKDFQEKYTNRHHPEHASALSRMNALFARAGDKAPV